MFDKLTRVLFLGMLATVVYVTIFNGDIAPLKKKLLTSMPGVATSMSVLLPTAAVPTKKIIIQVDPGTDNLGGEAVQTLPDCSTVPTTSACTWKNTTPTPLPALVPPTPVGHPVFDTTEEDIVAFVALVRKTVK